MKQKFLFLMALFSFLLMGGTSAWAHGGQHTGTVTVTKTGEGTVYTAATADAATGNTSYSWNCGNSDDGAHSGSCYVFAKPAAGYTFKGWSDQSSEKYSPLFTGTLNNGKANKTYTYTATFQLISGKSTDPMDVTGVIVNPGIQQYGESNTEPTGWHKGKNQTKNNDHVTEGTGDTRLEAWSNQSTINTNYYQTITGLPAGNYKIGALVHTRITGNAGIYAQTTASNDVDANAKKAVIADANAGDDKSETLKTDYVLVNGGSLTFGMFVNQSIPSGSNQWVTTDNFTLTYYGNPVSNQVTKTLTFGVENATESGKWYSMVIPATAEYNVPQGCLYTQDTNLTDSEVSTSFQSAKANLNAGTYYIKANSSSVTINVDNYEYTVGSATCSIANNSYVQNGTITFTFDSRTTTDPSATFAILNNKVRVNNSDVDDILSLNGKVLTLSLPEIAEGQTYSISIPAGTVGYSGQVSNEAINITVMTPALFDGYYYFKNSEGKYMSRGGSWGTQLIWDEYGIAMQVTTDVEGNSTLKCFDNNLYTDGDYSDKNSAKSFQITRSNNEVTFNNLTCTVETIETHKANYTANVNAQVAALGINDINTLEELESYIASKKATNTTIDGSKAEKYQQYSSNENPTVPNTYYSETITGLTPGLYRLTVDAFQRAAGYSWVTAAQGARGLIYLYANNAKTQLKSVMEYGATSAYNDNYAYEGLNYPNSQSTAYTALATGNYKNTVYVMVGEDGKLEVGIKNPVRQSNSGNNNIDNTQTWCVYNNWQLCLITDEEGVQLEGNIKKARAVNAVWNNDALAEAINNRNNDGIISALSQTEVVETFDEEESTWTGDNTGAQAYSTIDSYGSQTVLNSIVPPTEDMFGNSEGKLAGFSAGWDCKAQYTKDVDLTPGVYALYYEAYNANTTATTVQTNFLKVSNNTNTSYTETLGTAKTRFASEAWMADAIKVYVREEGTYKVSIGMQGSGSSNDNAKLWIDNVTFFKLADKVVETTVLTEGTEYYLKTEDAKYATTSVTYPILSASGNKFKVANNSLGETLFELTGTEKYMFFNDEPGNADQNYAVYTDGTNPPAKATHGLWWVIKSVDGGKYTIFNSMYQKYLGISGNYLTKTDEAYKWTLETTEQQELHPDMDMTGHITNPSFEFDQKVINNPTGWTVNASSDTGVKSTTNATYEAKGSDGKYLFNTWNDGKALTQTISALPAAGVYELSAMLATGDSELESGTVHLTVGDVKSAGMTARHGNKKYMKRETLTFVVDGAVAVEIGAIGANTGSGDMHWWYKADDFRLRYINETSKLFNIFQSVYNASAPWTSEGDYYTAYSGYASYSAETSQADLLAAINYMNSKYDDYCWDNASEEHPYLMQDVIAGAECTSNTEWDGSGRSTGKGQHWSGDAEREYFSFQNGTYRHQTVAIPYRGRYELRTAVRTLTNGAWARMKVVSENIENSTKTSEITGSTGGSINMDGTEGTGNLANNGSGYGWIYNKVYFPAITDGASAEITIELSDKDNVAEANAGGMYLYYVGDTYDYVKDGAHYYNGSWGDQSAELTNDVPILDVTNATGSFNVTATNTNGMVYTNGATINGVTNNIVSNGTCANLVLSDGHTFKAHKQFEATSATYTMGAVATTSAGKTFGTLMLPFAVSSLPEGAKAYALDQGVTFGEAIQATEVNSIAANAPVLVTVKGDYTASNVPIAATADTYTNGELVGTYKAMDALEGSYVLQKHDKRVAFYLVGDTKPTVNPFRAYIKAQAAANARVLDVIFDELDTSAEAITTYDSQIADGKYIENGKVVIVKNGVKYNVNGIRQ